MKLNNPKCQCSFTLFTTVSIVGVTSRSLSLVFLNILNQNEAKIVQIESENLKQVDCSIHGLHLNAIHEAAWLSLSKWGLWL